NTSRGIFGIGGRKARVRATVRQPLVFEAGEEERDDGESKPRSAVPPATAPARSQSVSAEKASGRDGRPLADSALAKARHVLQEVVKRIGSGGRVELISDADEARLVIEGDESGILIGRRGQTLDALEYLVNRIVWRADDSGARLIVDSQNYRSR